jgi:FkbM family methyltransferase
MGRDDTYALAMLDRLRGIGSLVRLALVTRSPLRFLLRQATRRREAAGYRLRRSGIELYVRHGTPDVAALEQVFRQGHYELPHDARRVLDGRRSLTVVDLGANIGAFGAWVLGEYPAAEVNAFEPEPGNAAVHRLATERYRGPGAWSLVEACAGTVDGEVRFRAGMFTNSRLAEGEEEGVVVPARDVFRWIDRADLVKIDIEGAEWDLLGDSRFRSIEARCVALEYHPERCMGEDPRTEAALALESAGFSWRDAEFSSTEGHGMIWAWKNA